MNVFAAMFLGGLVAREAASRARSSMPESKPPSRPIRVLLVDDDAENRRLVRDLLEGWDLDVVGEAADGMAGVELAGKLLPMSSSWMYECPSWTESKQRRSSRVCFLEPGWSCSPPMTIASFGEGQKSTGPRTIS